MSSKTIVLVTGANRGIGFEIVKALIGSSSSRVRSGSGSPYHVFLGSRDASKGKEAAASLESQNGSTVSALEIDVTSPESINKAVSSVKAETGRIDVLINNAGIVSGEPDPVVNLRKTLEANTIAPFAITEAFKPLLVTQPPAQGGTRKEKRIIHVSSSLGSISLRRDPTRRFYNVTTPEYRISKAALNMLAACNAFELKDEGVKAFSFDPGYAATSITGTPEQRRKAGAVEPSVSGELCRDIVEGKHDGDDDLQISVDFGTLAF